MRTAATAVFVFWYGAARGWRGRHMVPNKSNQWSQRVTERSRALDLEPGVFTLEDPRRIAQSLKRSALTSRRRKSDPFRSALSMLSFYINRAGSQLAAPQRKRLELAKDELRQLFGKPSAMRRSQRREPGLPARHRAASSRSVQ